jgi:adenine C2-methylase RlmN of 23S rRNA A2503 and tRNA A37
MKKILQDLSYAELEALVLALGEKKFRAKQLYEGLMQGKTVEGITSLSKAFKERLLEE